MRRTVSPKQAALALGVSESSLKRWCDRGRIPASRTPGGHRRLAVRDLVEFARSVRQQISRPELLGLPSALGSQSALDRAASQVCEALIVGDEEHVRRTILNLYLEGRSASSICDLVVAPALHQLGNRWECGSLEVYRERRACDLCARVIAELNAHTPRAPVGAPLAIGGTPECDPYSLPTAMAELVFRQAGWRAQSLGPRLPFATLVAAVRDLRPRVCWLSVSHIENQQGFLDAYREFYEAIGSAVAIIVGGAALTAPVRVEMSYASFGDNVEHLSAFAKAMKRNRR